jgi:antitoxin HicB
MAEHTCTVRIEPAEEGGHDVFVPALLGCVTQGETFEEAVAMAEEAIEGYLEAPAKVGEAIPVEPQPTGPLTAAVRVHTPALA